MEDLDINPKNEIDKYQSYLKELFDLFGVNKISNLIMYFKNIDKTANVCAKQLKAGIGAWFCKNCEKDSTCIICNDCYEKSKEKHIGHEVKFKTTVSGCCDCGDPDAWDPSGFCSDHSGLITSDDEIEKNIIETFDNLTLTKLNEILMNVFNQINDIIYAIEKTQNSELKKLICDIMIFIGSIGESNFAILSLLIKYFSKYYNKPSDHICSSFNYDSLNIDFNTYNTHCTCPLLLNMVKIWDASFDNRIKIDKLFYPFLKSYKFKFLFGYSYLLLIDTIMKNGSQHIKNFYIQVAIEEFCVKIAESEEFIYNLFDKIYHLIEQHLKTPSRIDNLVKVMFGFYVDITYIIKPKSSKILAKNKKILFRLIDILSIYHNYFKFKVSNSFQYEGYKDSYISIELYLLSLFSLLTSNFNFTDENGDDVLTYIYTKIKNSEKLKNDEFSFNIVLNRAFSIFLNRYSITISNQMNILPTLNNILMKNYSKFDKNNYSYCDYLNDILADTLRFIGFINSIPANYWVYYGERMYFYYQIFYSCEIFYLSDFCLLKYIMSQDTENKLTSISNYMNKTNILNSYTDLINSNEINMKHDEKSIVLFNKNMEILIKILINSDYILDLFAFSYKKFQDNKLEDEVLIKVITNNHNSYENLKKKIIHTILSNDNNILYSILDKNLLYYEHKLMNKSVEHILNSYCNKISLANKPISFRVKKEILNDIDLYYIVDPNKKSKAERHIIENENDISIINTPDLITLSILEDIHLIVIKNLFSNLDNINLSVKIIVILLKSLSDGLNVSQNMFINFTKIITVFVKHHIKLEIDYNFAELKSILESNISDQYIHKVCNYLNKLLSSKETICDYVDEKKRKAKEMKEKYSALFKAKTDVFKLNMNNQINEEISVYEDLNLHEDNNLTCVVCRDSLNKEEFSKKPYGKLGTFSNSNFIYKTLLETIEFEYSNFNKMNIDDDKILKELTDRFQKGYSWKKGLRFTTCNHMIHYDCYIQQIHKSYVYGFNNNIVIMCPLCKTPSNTFLPKLDINHKSVTLENEDILQNQNIQHIIYFLENVLSFYNKTQVLVTDFNKNPDLVYNCIILFFIDCVYLVDILRDDNYNMILELIKEFILCLRIIIKKNKCIDYFEKRLFDLREYWRIEKLNSFDLIKRLFYENLFLMKLLLNESDVEIYKEFYINYYPWIITQICNKKLLINSNFNIHDDYNYDTVFNFLSSYENNEFIIKHLSFFLRKILLIRDVIDKNSTKDIFSDINHEYSFYCESLGISTDTQGNFTKFTDTYDINIKELINHLILINSKGKVSTYLDILNPYLLLITKNITYDCIKLPKSLLEISSTHYKNICNNCGTNPILSILCLTCNTKLCFTNKCCNNLGKKKNLREVTYHIKKCGKGEGIFLHLYNGEISYAFLNLFITSGTNLYQNRFGESVKGTSITNEFILKEDTYDLVWKEFRNLSYIKYFKSISRQLRGNLNDLIN